MVWPPQGYVRHEQVVDGWHHEQDDDHDDDVVKIWHYAVHEDGRRVTLDWSPYSNIPPHCFEQLVRLGFPGRIGIGPLDEADLRRLVEEAQERVERQHDAALDSSQEI